MEKKKFTEGIFGNTATGEVCLYKNGKQIRKGRFSGKNNGGRGRINQMREMLQYSNTHLNNYYFIIKLDD